MTGADHPVDPWVLMPAPDVTAAVLTAPVPEIPPAALRDILIPRFSDDGRLDDWLVEADGIADEQGLGSYWTWRRKWCRTWPMGSQGNIEALLHQAAELSVAVGTPLTELLHRLATMIDGEELLSVLDADAVDVLLDDLEMLRSQLAGSRLLGVGVVDDTPSATPRSGLARTWPPPLTEQTLAADRSTALLLRPGDDLVLMLGGPHYVSTPHVVAVDLTQERAVVTTADGGWVELAADAARPLAWVVPNALAWHLRPIPIVTVWSTLFAGLPEAVRIAQRVGSSVVFTVTSPVV